MTETICPDCGERNAGRAEFCGACGAFLAWDAGDDAVVHPEPERQAPTPAWASTVPVVVAAQHDPLPGSQPGTAPDRGAVQGGGPAVATRTRGQDQPPEGASVPVESSSPIEGSCPRCAVVNDAARRFCRKCGFALSGPVLRDDGPIRPEPAPERIAWWRRWFRPGDKTRRAARRAYRHSLPLRYRLVRWVLGLLGVGAIVGAMTLIGQNPVGWVTDRINDLRGSLVQVEGLQAYTAPQGAADPVATGGAADPPGGTGVAPAAPDTAENVLDNLSDTAWTTPWSAANQSVPADASCVAPSAPSAAGSPGSLLIVPSATLTVRQISVAAGRSKADPGRMLEWRPKTIQLAFSDGTCQQITLPDSDQLQPAKIDPVQTTQIRLSIIDAYPPGTDAATDLVAITDIRLFQRP